MILNLKRYISLLLVLMLLIGIVPTVNAAELDSESTLPEETVSEASEQTGQTDPTEPTEPTEPTAPPGDTGDADLVDPGTASEVGDYAVMSIASTQNSIMLFDYADNGTGLHANFREIKKGIVLQRFHVHPPPCQSFIHFSQFVRT